MIKQLITAGIGIFLAFQSTAQLPKSFIGKTFYNTDKFDLNPRFGGMPSLQIKTATTGEYKRGDIMELVSITNLKATVKGKAVKGFVIKGKATGTKDTFYVRGNEFSDKYGQIWTSNVSKITNSQELNAFPQAKEGFTRNVINLPELKNEDQYIVELYAGKIMEVDCNNHQMLGEFTLGNVNGYGYSYYDVLTEERTLSTRKFCDGNEKFKKFVYMKPTQTVYNSKLPIVIYAPTSVQIRYKIYKANDSWNYSITQ